MQPVWERTGNQLILLFFFFLLLAFIRFNFVQVKLLQWQQRQKLDILTLLYTLLQVLDGYPKAHQNTHTLCILWHLPNAPHQLRRLLF